MIIGHKKQISLLKNALEKNVPNQAYLFCGPEGIGKKKVALDFAEKIIGTPRKGKINPDLILVEPEKEQSEEENVRKKEIGIEKTREIIRQSGLSPQFGKCRVTIFDEAENLTKEAQSAILKTLEESPKNSVFVLVAGNEKKLLPTIVSRCQKIKFFLVPDSETEKFLDGPEETKKKALFWSLGRPGIALDLASGKENFDFYDETVAELKKVLSGNLPEKFDLAEKLGKNKIELDRKLRLWTAFIRKTGKNIKENVFLIEKISAAAETVKNTNANSRLVLENLFLNLN